MKRISLPIESCRLTDDLHPTILQAAKYLAAHAEGNGFISRDEVENLLKKKKLQISQSPMECCITYRSSRGLSITRRFRYPEEVKHDDEF
jgi:hypothetical protein